MRIDSRRALIQTVDFLTPVVDDPFRYGEIAAANALSDVYAMGGRPFAALNILGLPDDGVPPAVAQRILAGGAAKSREAGCLILGGHSIRNPQPIYGLSVSGWAHPRRLMTHDAARPGDLLVLTKPLGTGIVATGIKRQLARPAEVHAAIRSMTRLNTVGATVAEGGWCRAGTDVTGFGLLGHLGNLCRSSGVIAEVHAGALPALPGVWRLIDLGAVPGGTQANLEAGLNWTTFDPGVTESQRQLVADAQTSGGLLLCVPRRHWPSLRNALTRNRVLCATVIGSILAAGKPRIHVLSGSQPDSP